MKASAQKCVSTIYKTIKKTTFWVTLLFLALLGMVIYQQSLIIDLQTQINSIHDSSQKESLSYRVSNLEHIINAHTATIREQGKDIYHLQKAENQVSWKLMKLDWDTRGDATSAPNDKDQRDMSKFDSNPQQVPLPPYQKPNPDEILPPITRSMLPQGR